jgi:ribosomal protein L16 Arg81 hydroxylase
MKTLQYLICPQPKSAFFEEYWSRRFLVVRGEPEKFQRVFSLTAFEDLVRCFGTLLNYPRVTIYSAAGLVHESRFTFGSDIRISGALGYTEERRVDFDRIRLLLSRGATMKISEIDALSVSLTDFVDSLSAELREKIHINLYYSAPQSRAFAEHFDKHDVFIMQIAGRKCWQVFDYQERFPLPGMKKSRDARHCEAPKHEFQLNRGDFLYVPRGMWHNAFTTDSNSLHLTVGIQCATPIDLVRWLVERLVSAERFRQNLTHTNGNLPELLKTELKQAFAAHLDDSLFLNAFYEEWANRQKRATHFSLPPESPSEGKSL